jgi:hypothetical protein
MTEPGFYWGADVPISMPVPGSDDVLIDMGAHGFTLNGLQHNLTQADLEEYLQPNFSPPLDDTSGK